MPFVGYCVFGDICTVVAVIYEIKPVELGGGKNKKAMVGCVRAVVEEKRSEKCKQMSGSSGE